jgi:hypothetical protein
MTTLASTIIGKAKILAQDIAGIRWLDPEWCGWLTDGEREVVTIRPSAYTKVVNTPLVAGTKQTIPADGILFMEYIRHMGAGGATPGIPARKVERRLMDSQNPSWHSTTAAAAPQHYVFDPAAPKTFYIYPQSAGSSFAEIVYSAHPVPITATSQALSLDDIYANVLLDYVLYRAYGKDNEFIANAERSVFYRKAFENSMGLKQQADATSVASSNQRG